MVTGASTLRGKAVHITSKRQERLLHLHSDTCGELGRGQERTGQVSSGAPGQIHKTIVDESSPWFCSLMRQRGLRSGAVALYITTSAASWQPLQTCQHHAHPFTRLLSCILSSPRIHPLRKHATTRRTARWPPVKRPGLCQHEHAPALFAPATRAHFEQHSI